MTEAKNILRQYWGYDDFRPLQENIITSVLEGLDTLALMPTGGGKSLCYQVPAMIKDGICLVVSPLIALMKDQVANLTQRKIPSLLIHSGMSPGAIQITLRIAAHGNFKFLYVSPERLQTNLFLDYLPAIKVSLLAVDEAHCISQWGYDFRPSYLQIAQLREHLADVSLLALTASATRPVQKDICEKLQFKKGSRVFQASFSRPNLSYSVFEEPSRQTKLLKILRNVPGSAIVYCKTRKRTRQVADMLRMNKISAEYYHAGLTGDERSAKQDSWLLNRVRVIVCTNAFGMGIDKPNVRSVIHYDIPDALENYYQEAGRAGRDGNRAYAVLLHNAADIIALQQQVAKKFPSLTVVREVYGALMNYLQLPEGSGEGQVYDFNLQDFAFKFKQDSIVVLNVLQLLEQENILSYNYQFFKPATLVFTVGKESLLAFQESHPEYEELTKSLLRIYDGVFDFPAAIDEETVGKLIGGLKETVIASIKQLQAYGVVKYDPVKESPHLTVLEDRVRTADLNINSSNFKRRKSAYETRLEAMVNYTRESTICRGQMIAGYFGDTIQRCGICDNCIDRKVPNLSMELFEGITAAINHAISTGHLNTEQILAEIKQFRKSQVTEVLKFLLAEERLGVSHEGLLFLVK